MTRIWLGLIGNDEAQIDTEEYLREHPVDDPDNPEEPQWFERAPQAGEER